ncbi:hypothetical protein L9F63_015287 [Diploptera punctata]|uniref:G-protein coupled receptors family 1 profile domain-containing protein n=1 Tax=Diploptera punctata TaxID=6984 RepID=A0AAD8EK48_DIPPU|nr:hypothetical protein L9F63_015287 [Diploptera punctata]
MCNELQSTNSSISCVSIISNKSKPLNCLLFINAADFLHYESKFDCNEYSDMAENFLSTGDVIYGFKMLTACQDTYESLERCRDVNPRELEELQYDPDELLYVCSFYKQAYDIALQQNVCLQIAVEVDILRSSEQSVYTTEFMRAKYVTELRKLYTEALSLKNKMDFYNLSHVLDNSFILNVTGSEMKRIVEEGMEFNKDLDEYRTLLYYVYGPVDFVLFIIGFIGNLSLIMIFVRFDNVRTPQNMLLLNLALGDILNLLSNIMTALIVEVIFENHFTYFSPATCKCIACMQHLSIGLSVYAVVFLSIQRYIFIRSSSTYTVCRLPVKTVVTLNILAVWVMSLGLCIPVTVLSTSDSYGVCFIPKDFDPTMWNVLFICIIPIVTVSLFYTLSACRLAHSARNIPGEKQGSERTRKARSRGAGVLLALSGVFAFSFLPYVIYLYLIHSKYISPSSDGWEYVLFKLTFLNPVVNPFALYFGSGSFKRHFKNCCSRRRHSALSLTESHQTRITKSSKWTTI